MTELIFVISAGSSFTLQRILEGMGGNSDSAGFTAGIAGPVAGGSSTAAGGAEGRAVAALAAFPACRLISSRN